jgi:hypothetical protein
VQNYLSSDKKVRVSLEAKGLLIAQGGTRDLVVAAKGTETADFSVKVPAGREAVLTATALTSEESDALELTIPVQPFGVRMSEARGGAFSGAANEADAELTFPESTEPGSRSLEITVSPSVAGAMFDALEYLTSFPYGCTEQTMSSFLPNVIVSQAVKSLNLKSRVDEAQLKQKVKAGLDRLYDYHHQDGGWGWWKSDESDPFMTAYVVAGLSQAKKAGFDVDDDHLARGAAWLRAGHAGRLATTVETQAYTAYALALAGLQEKPRLDSLHGQRNSLSAHALALTGLAMRESGDSRAAEIAAILESQAKQSDLEAWWPSTRDALLDVEIENTPETTAFAVKLLSGQRPQSPLLPKAALYLVNHRSGGYYWNSTKQTAMVIHGLTDFVRQSGELKPKFTATVYVNGQVALWKKYGEGDALAPATLTIPAAGLLAGSNKIHVVRAGEGRVYWSARAHFYSTMPDLNQRGGQQLSLERDYFKMVSSDEGGRIVYKLEPFTGSAAQGDLLAVRLTLDGGAWRYLMVEDPIPSGTEIVQRDDLYQFRAKPAWWSYWFTNREFRDDRAVFFQTWFNRGRSTYFYLLKVVNPGQFRVSPARVEPMYQPQYFATSGALDLEVTR